VTARAGSTRLRWGGATDVGRVRSNNQDQYVARDDVGLWAVADGMGGHRGGEVASEIACATLARVFDHHTLDGLIDAIEQANRAVFQAGNSDPELSGMGTTVVALAVVDHEGEELLAIANVGDSRVYRYSGAELDQITIDHSLVADLVREGSLSPDEAATHPQRNILTRVLGVYDDVPVDAVAVEPHHGDRFVLCSDGLFNEVSEAGIASVLRRLGDPADAAGELVRMAVEGGGRDNVTVVVVDVVDDGGRDAAASAALAAEGAPGRAPSPRGGGGGAGGATARARIPGASPAYAAPSGLARRAQARAGGIDGGPDLDGGDLALADDRAGNYDQNDEPDGDGYEATGRHSKRRGRRITWRVVAFTLLLFALVAGAFATIQWYGGAAYFVGFQGDKVAIFKGRPGGLLWIDPKLVETTELERDRVPPSRVNDIEAGQEQSSLAEARRYVANVNDLADELDPPTTSTTRPTRTTTTRRPATTTTAAARP
jgi:PPM family protein phosphatase